MNSVWGELPDLHGVGLRSLSGRREFTRGQTWLWALVETERYDNLTTHCVHFCGPIARVNYVFKLCVFILWLFTLGVVNADSVWSAAHSQSSTLQYPFLVQPQSSGTPQPRPAAEPCPPLSGNVWVVLTWKRVFLIFLLYVCELT